jgi:hypothetical protein
MPSFPFVGAIFAGLRIPFLIPLAHEMNSRRTQTNRVPTASCPPRRTPAIPQDQARKEAGQNDAVSRALLQLNPAIFGVDFDSSYTSLLRIEPDDLTGLS